MHKPGNFEKCVFHKSQKKFQYEQFKFFYHLLCVSVNLGMYRFSFPTASSQTILLFCTTNKFRNIQEINKIFLLERSLSAFNLYLAELSFINLQKAAGKSRYLVIAPKHRPFVRLNDDFAPGKNDYLLIVGVRNR